MPLALKPLSSEETEQLFSKSTKLDLSEYKTQLQQLQQGQGAEVEVAEDERRKVVRAFNRAAKELQIKLKWLHNDGHTYVRVVGSPGDVEQPDSDDPESTGDVESSPFSDETSETRRRSRRAA